MRPVASEVAVTETPGSAPLVESATVPKMEASCANAEAAISTMAAAKKTDGTHAHIAPFPWRGIPDEPDETLYRVSDCNRANGAARKLARTIAHGSMGWMRIAPVIQHRL